MPRTSCSASSSRKRQRARQERAAHEALVTAPAQAEGPEAQILEGELLAEVARALLAVKPQHRRVLVLRIVHGLTNIEIKS